MNFVDIRHTRKYWSARHLLGVTFLSFVACLSESNLNSQDVEYILFQAKQSIGAFPHDAPWQIYSEAEVNVGNEHFQTLVYSAFDGRVRMEQRPFGFLAAVGEHGNWYFNADTGEVNELGPRLSFVRGHELHAFALDPESRLREGEYIGRTTFAEQEALTIRFLMQDEDSVLMHFSPESYLPLGIELVSQQPIISVHFSEWYSIGEILIFGKADIYQAQDIFSYDFTTVEISEVTPIVFEPPDGI